LRFCWPDEHGHILLGHAKDETVSRALREVEAEGVALFCCEALGLDGAVYARGYLQHWLGKEALTEAMAQRIVSTAHPHPASRTAGSYAAP